jgi:glycerol-3-phosphate acyltransferase PlsY
MIATQPETAGACAGTGNGTPLGVSDWLALAAAPTFAIMALLTAVVGNGAMDSLCLAAHSSPLGGMVPMYLLMSAFHLAPWLKLAGRRRVVTMRKHLSA